MTTAYKQITQTDRKINEVCTNRLSALSDRAHYYYYCYYYSLYDDVWLECEWVVDWRITLPIPIWCLPFFIYKHTLRRPTNEDHQRKKIDRKQKRRKKRRKIYHRINKNRVFDGENHRVHRFQQERVHLSLAGPRFFSNIFILMVLHMEIATILAY